jgi:hypothetical protein
MTREHRSRSTSTTRSDRSRSTSTTRSDRSRSISTTRSRDRKTKLSKKQKKLYKAIHENTVIEMVGYGSYDAAMFSVGKISKNRPESKVLVIVQDADRKSQANESLDQLDVSAHSEVGISGVYLCTYREYLKTFRQKESGSKSVKKMIDIGITKKEDWDYIFAIAESPNNHDRFFGELVSQLIDSTDHTVVAPACVSGILSTDSIDKIEYTINDVQMIFDSGTDFNIEPRTGIRSGAVNVNLSGTSYCVCIVCMIILIGLIFKIYDFSWWVCCMPYILGMATLLYCNYVGLITFDSAITTILTSVVLFILSQVMIVTLIETRKVNVVYMRY